MRAQPSNRGCDTVAMRVGFRLVDVFAEAPFTGNQLCVIPESPEGLGDETMQALAREIGFSETTFVTSIRDDGYDVRIFTPDAELPFAGHPTLGTAFVLHAEGRIGASAVQTCTAGAIPVVIDLRLGRAGMRQLPPSFGAPVADRAAVASAAGLGPNDLVEALPVVAVSTGIAHLLTPVRDEAALRRARRDDLGCVTVCAANDVESVYLFAVRGGGDVVVRMFDRGSSIGEDAATGSGAGPLGAYLSGQGLAGMPGHMTVAQGEMVARPSLLYVDVATSGETWTIDVSGGVRIVGDGAFEA
jgi:trans-2,3-dihydro-3-hydroxyanthranilate isomerase